MDPNADRFLLESINEEEGLSSVSTGNKNDDIPMFPSKKGDDIIAFFQVQGKFKGKVECINLNAAGGNFICVLHEDGDRVDYTQEEFYRLMAEASKAISEVVDSNSESKGGSSDNNDSSDKEMGNHSDGDDDAIIVDDETDSGPPSLPKANN
eukprot:4256207-Ditylum_brightwellii.AAC.1